MANISNTVNDTGEVSSQKLINDLIAMQDICDRRIFEVDELEEALELHSQNLTVSRSACWCDACDVQGILRMHKSPVIISNDADSNNGGHVGSCFSEFQDGHHFNHQDQLSSLYNYQSSSADHHSGFNSPMHTSRLSRVSGTTMTNKKSRLRLRESELDTQASTPGDLEVGSVAARQRRRKTASLVGGRSSGQLSTNRASLKVNGKLATVGSASVGAASRFSRNLMHSRARGASSGVTNGSRLAQCKKSLHHDHHQHNRIPVNVGRRGRNGVNDALKTQKKCRTYAEKWLNTNKSIVKATPSRGSPRKVTDVSEIKRQRREEIERPSRRAIKDELSCEQPENDDEGDNNSNEKRATGRVRKRSIAASDNCDDIGAITEEGKYARGHKPEGDESDENNRDEENDDIADSEDLTKHETMSNSDDAVHENGDCGEPEDGDCSRRQSVGRRSRSGTPRANSFAIAPHGPPLVGGTRPAGGLFNRPLTPKRRPPVLQPVTLQCHKTHRVRSGRAADPSQVRTIPPPPPPSSRQRSSSQSDKLVDSEATMSGATRPGRLNPVQGRNVPHQLVVAERASTKTTARVRGSSQTGGSGSGGSNNANRESKLTQPALLLEVEKLDDPQATAVSAARHRLHRHHRHDRQHRRQRRLHHHHHRRCRSGHRDNGTESNQKSDRGAQQEVAVAGGSQRLSMGPKSVRRQSSGLSSVVRQRRRQRTPPQEPQRRRQRSVSPEGQGIGKPDVEESANADANANRYEAESGETDSDSEADSVGTASRLSRRSCAEADRDGYEARRGSTNGVAEQDDEVTEQNDDEADDAEAEDFDSEDAEECEEGEDNDSEQQEESDNQEKGESGEESDESVDKSLYCVCKKGSFGEMIACDNARCNIEWFHFACVDVRAQPKGKWFCPQCRGETAKVKRSDL